VLHSQGHVWCPRADGKPDSTDRRGLDTGPRRGVVSQIADVPGHRTKPCCFPVMPAARDIKSLQRAPENTSFWAYAGSVSSRWLWLGRMCSRWCCAAAAAFGWGSGQGSATPALLCYPKEQCAHLKCSSVADKKPLTV